MFNLNRKVLSEIEFRDLQKGFDYAWIQNKINEPELIYYLTNYAKNVLNDIFVITLHLKLVKFQLLDLKASEIHQKVK